MADCAPQGAPRLEFAEQFVHVLALELETAVTRVAAISTLPSIVKGIPLSEEPGLGALTLPGLFREVTSRFAEREALSCTRRAAPCVGIIRHYGSARPRLPAP